MRLRSRESGESVVSEAPEGEAPVSRWASLTKWMYMLFLAGIMGLLVWYAVYAYYHYEGSGQIRVQRTVVSPERAGRIQKIWPDEGEAVLRGDSLMVVEPSQACEPERLPVVERNQQQSREQAELLDLQIQNLQNRLERKRRELTQMQERRALELETPASRRAQLEEEIQRLEGEIEQLRLQRRQAQERARQLADLPPEQDPRCAPFVVSAPYSGGVYQIYEDEFSVVSAGTPVMSITRSTSPVFVFAYLEPDLTGHVRPGDTLRVRLPSGSTSRGVVEKTYASAQEFAQIKYDVYRPYRSQLTAKLAPVSQKVEERWREHDRVNVEVEGEISQW